MSIPSSPVPGPGAEPLRAPDGVRSGARVSERWRLLLLNLLLGGCYLVLAKPAQAAFPLASPFWPPAALTVFGAMLWGWRVMPGLGLGFGVQKFQEVPGGHLA